MINEAYMDIKNIETFIKVAEKNSFTKVALETNYAQSTITTQIKQLENELGYPLFDRIGRSVSLTPYGLEFLKTSYRIISEFERAKLLKSEEKNISGELRIGVIESLLFSEVSKVLADFKNEFKNVDVKIKMGQANDLVDLLRHNFLDIVYISAELNYDKDLQCVYKERENLVFIAASNHQLSCKNRIAPKNLFSHDFVVTEHTGICYNRLLKIANENNLSLHASIEVDSTIAIADLVSKNLALGFLPEYSVRDKINSGEIVILDTLFDKQYYYKQLLCHRSRFLTPFIKRMIEMISNI